VCVSAQAQELLEGLDDKAKGYRLKHLLFNLSLRFARQRCAHGPLAHKHIPNISLLDVFTEAASVDGGGFQ
jgi:hypothetical protein